MSGINYHTPFGMRATRSRFAKFWHEGHREAKKDFRARWRAAALGFLGFCWLAGLIIILIMVTVFHSSNGYVSSGSDACLPDGSFALDPSTYNYWSKSGFFQITLGFGSLTFSEAKAIDIVWDVVIGRGGQALLALVSWNVFAKYVTTSMEVAPVTFRTYRTVFLQDQSLLFAIPHMIRDFMYRYALHSKIAMIFMILTMAFTLAFPTFASAMTGYSGNVKAYVNSTDSNFVPLDAFSFVTYVIHDGSRINKNDDYLVLSHGYSDKGPILIDDEYEGIVTHCASYVSYLPTEQLDDCFIYQNVSSYVKQYDFFGTSNKSSKFLGINLDPPVLNISAFYLPWGLVGSRYDRPDNLSATFDDKSRMRWAYANNTYSRSELEGRGRCQPLAEYQWGFSFIQLVIMMSLLLLWTIGIYILWLRSRSIMKERGRNAIAGEQKAILELAAAMHEQLALHEQEHGVDKSSLSETRLRRRINEDLLGGSISYESSLLSVEEDEKNGAGRGFWSWIKREKWWLTALFVTLGLAATSGAFAPIYALGIHTFPLEIGLTMYIGTTGKSRAIVLFWLFIALSVVVELGLGLPLAYLYFGAPY